MVFICGRTWIKRNKNCFDYGEFLIIEGANIELIEDIVGFDNMKALNWLLYRECSKTMRQKELVKRTYKLEAAAEIGMTDPHNKLIGAFYVWKEAGDGKKRLHINPCEPSLIHTVQTQNHLVILGRYLYIDGKWIKIESE
ncbi:hypothetical protein [Paenibacillus alba]|uniref:YopX protein domain-containing protein n=1 Tax=Paenibacillus alba TaxID=1197127 RepID=A0ABU6G4D7_9BACL|nr:hypothetical protein [Paenibacillus alba]MEC0229040.1 hypothetical protein [Paenibacillus alba]